MIALAAPLRKLPDLAHLELEHNQIGDEGVAALVAPGEGVLPKLEYLSIERNKIANPGCAALVTALESDALPVLKELVLLDPDLGFEDGELANPACHSAVAAVYAARPALTASNGKKHPFVGDE